ncbi:hypothetical protein GWI33_018965 [Rhynchophorus ferrugineus]|uniref:Uncharacterized protein n=1 Tax=Rhynchophorus ferrugineus TaxID=354439 RepID=A0A834M1U1_RHYFE|nr:hypothetical protein GWI33_018965 [Rhynchophorus ferrugineus]
MYSELYFYIIRKQNNEICGNPLVSFASKPPYINIITQNQQHNHLTLTKSPPNKNYATSNPVTLQQRQSPSSSNSVPQFNPTRYEVSDGES